MLANFLMILVFKNVFYQSNRIKMHLSLHKWPYNHSNYSCVEDPIMRTGTPASRKTDKYNILCRNTDTHSHGFFLPDTSCTHIVQTVVPIGPFITFPAWNLQTSGTLENKSLLHERLFLRRKHRGALSLGSTPAGSPDSCYSKWQSSRAEWRPTARCWSPPRLCRPGWGPRWPAASAGCPRSEPGDRPLQWDLKEKGAR